jgi:hypothetical protein
VKMEKAKLCFYSAFMHNQRKFIMVYGIETNLVV